MAARRREVGLLTAAHAPRWPRGAVGGIQVLVCRERDDMAGTRRRMDASMINASEPCRAGSQHLWILTPATRYELRVWAPLSATLAGFPGETCNSESMGATVSCRQRPSSLKKGQRNNWPGQRTPPCRLHRVSNTHCTLACTSFSIAGARCSFEALPGIKWGPRGARGVPCASATPSRTGDPTHVPRLLTRPTPPHHTRGLTRLPELCTCPQLHCWESSRSVSPGSAATRGRKTLRSRLKPHSSPSLCSCT